MRGPGRLFEWILIQVRWLLIAPVLALTVGAGLLCYRSVMDVIAAFSKAKPEDMISEILKAVDSGLLAAIVIIVALALYELFIDRIEPADNKSLGQTLQVGDLEGLKNRLGKAIILVFIVRFFDFVTKVEFEETLDLLIYAGALAFLALTLYLVRDLKQDNGEGGGDESRGSEG